MLARGWVRGGDLRLESAHALLTAHMHYTINFMRGAEAQIVAVKKLWGAHGCPVLSCKHSRFVRTIVWLDCSVGNGLPGL